MVLNLEQSIIYHINKDSWKKKYNTKIYNILESNKKIIMNEYYLINWNYYYKNIENKP